jgi:hypothetical protein
VEVAEEEDEEVLTVLPGTLGACTSTLSLAVAVTRVMWGWVAGAHGGVVLLHPALVAAGHPSGQLSVTC